MSGAGQLVRAKFKILAFIIAQPEDFLFCLEVLLDYNA
jgi:hypothetical protein